MEVLGKVAKVEELSVEKEKTFWKAIAEKEKAEIQAKIHQVFGGEVEVETVYGRADLVTESTVYEIKHYTQWKQAYGQVVIYNKILKRKPALIFFGQPDDDMKKIISEGCDPVKCAFYGS